MFSELRLLVRLAARNLLSSRTNVVIRMLILLGSFLITTANALLQSVDYALSRSVSGSVAGDAQVYSSESVDELSLWGAPDQLPDLAPVPDFARWKKTLESVAPRKGGGAR